ncbi:hypothetical protein E2C01_020594 [Portunus trituberculatus]|uniref:Uncharacterized protein n=1 Tax=Portunus trituberculatus TaxID=210409 RepID=A0A5B7E3U4_PORTR|nr:hypothetical protein [Portunus trituberculatus]
MAAASPGGIRSAGRSRLIIAVTTHASLAASPNNTHPTFTNRKYREFGGGQASDLMTQRL